MLNNQRLSSHIHPQSRPVFCCAMAPPALRRSFAAKLPRAPAEIVAPRLRLPGKGHLKAPAQRHCCPWFINGTHMHHGAGIFTNICPCPKSPSFVGSQKNQHHGAY